MEVSDKGQLHSKPRRAMSTSRSGEWRIGALADCFRVLTARNGCLACLVGILMLAAPSLRAQSFEPTFTVGAGLQGSYAHTAPDVGTSLDQFSLNHARIYLSGEITSNISVMLNTDYNSATNNMGILDAAGEFHLSPKFNVWFGRFLPPSDRANLYGPFYSNEWDVF